MDEETPHMHLVFIPVVHTQDKKGNSIDKIKLKENVGKCIEKKEPLYYNENNICYIKIVIGMEYG